MRSSTLRIAAAAVLAAIALAACSSSSKSGSSTTSPTEAATSPPTVAPTTNAPTSTGSAGAKTVSLATVTVKGKSEKILVDGNGMTLYVDENDKPGKPACTGACLQVWPPLKATGAITVGPGLTAAKYSTVTASDGTRQVAVNGSPLYLWMGDKKPGDATGQDVNGFYVVMASGVKYDPGATQGS
jgi:predicted lipoprotein with Yx(FWY)xxD motif